MDQCDFILRSGKRKGEMCCVLVSSGSKCKRHSKLKTSLSVVSLPNLKYLETVDVLNLKLMTLDTTTSNKNIINKKLKHLESLNTTSNEYQKNLNWLRHAINIPYSNTIQCPAWENSSQITEYISDAYTKLDQYIYGMDNVKEELLSFICKRVSNPDSETSVLGLLGSNGVGKTRLAKGLSIALGLPMRTINCGTLNDVSILCGHNQTFQDSSVGRIVEILEETHVKNCIIYFDELDKIHSTDKGQSINSFITHLIDPSQNTQYQDNYLSGIDIDLSKVLFVMSFNSLELLDPTVRDRIKVVRVKDPTTKDKTEIAEKFMLPEITANTKIELTISKEFIDKVVAVTGKNKGLRGVRRLLEEIVDKLNVLRLVDDAQKSKLSFYKPTIEETIDYIISNDEENKETNYDHIYS